MLSSSPTGSESLFESQLVAVENALETHFRPVQGGNFVENIRVLRRLMAMNKSGLESLLNSGAIISFNDEEHERLKQKMADIVVENERAMNQ